MAEPFLHVEGRRVRFALGHTLTQRTTTGDAYSYTLASVEPYVTKAGAASALLIWAGACAVCGKAFTATSSRRPNDLVRTCTTHRGKLRRGRKVVANA